MSLAHIVALTNKTFRSWFIARNRRGGQEQEVVGVRIAVRSKEILVRAPAYASVVQPANARSGVNSDARVQIREQIAAGGQLGSGISQLSAAPRP